MIAYALKFVVELIFLIVSNSLMRLLMYFDSPSISIISWVILVSLYRSSSNIVHSLIRSHGRNCLLLKCSFMSMVFILGTGFKRQKCSMQCAERLLEVIK